MPTSPQTLRSIASAYDVEFRYYTSSLDYNAAELANINVNSTYTPSADWTAITDIVRNATCNDIWADDGGSRDFTVTITGNTYNSTTLATGKACLAMRRMSDGTTWSSWLVWWIGWFASMPGVRDDYRAGGDWGMQVESLSRFTRSDDCPALRFGKTNIASGKSVTVSGTLGTPMLEAGNGEYLGYTSEIDAGDAVDGNMDTLWISEDAPSVTAEVPSFPGDPPNYAINEIFYWPVGYDYTYGWIEIFCRGGQSDAESGGLGIQSWYLYSASTGLTLDFAKSNISDILKSGGTDDDGNTIYHYAILCYDERKFRDMFDAGDAVVIEWRNMVCTDWSSGSAWSYDPTGDILVANYPPNTLTDRECVAIGTIDATGYSGWNSSATNITTPSQGHSVRRNPAGYCTSANYSVAGDFTEELYPSPGHHQTSLPAGWEYISVDLGTISFSLEQELAPADTLLYTVAGTAGLTKAGQILMDGNILTYTDRTSTTLAVPAGVRTATYAAGTVFQQYASGVATDHWLVNEVGWKRPYIVDGTTPRVPQYFRVYTSAASSPIYPPDNNWKTDWDWRFNTENNLDSTWEHTIQPGRYRHVMLVVRQMSDEGRVKINELEVHPAYWTVTGGGNPILANGMLDDVFDYLLTTQFGLLASQVSTDYNVYVGPFDTRQAKYHTILVQLARQAGLVVSYNKDATISIVRDPSYPMHDLSVTTHTFNRTNMQNFEYVKQWPRIRQVEVNGYNPNTQRTYTARYPSEPSSTGELVTVDVEYILGSREEAMNLAKSVYLNLVFYNNRGGFMPVGPVSDWLEPLQRIRITWDLDAGVNDDVDSLFLVTAVSTQVDLTYGNKAPYRETVKVMEYAL